MIDNTSANVDDGKGIRLGGKKKVMSHQIAIIVRIEAALNPNVRSVSERFLVFTRAADISAAELGAARVAAMISCCELISAAMLLCRVAYVNIKAPSRERRNDTARAQKIHKKGCARGEGV